MLRYFLLRACLLLLSFFLFCIGKTQPAAPLFRLLPAAQTGIYFNNQLTESDTLNILNQANIYNGGGVGIADFNGDGLMDVYLAGNMVSGKLYLNMGNLQFKDVTDAAGVAGDGRWATGVAVVDINTDGLPDMYVSCSFRKDPNQRTNLLYINQGVNSQGVPAFKEAAAAYGLADAGFSTQAYFFDYDRDGDLDMYQVTNELYDSKTPIRFRPKVKNGSAKNTDRLYRNNGNGTFTNVSKEAGITMEGWGHAACITDLNGDGWPDVYVANDFVSNDLCFINNRDGTFTNRLGQYFKHTGWNAMGTDAVDINNDGFTDFISLEMLPESNLRKKRMLSGNEYYNYTNSAKYGYEHQYVRNVLQLNSGSTPLGHPVFSDIGFMAGVYQTDWSWCPLVADFDNDGWRDIIITNGLPRDVTDLDYVAYNNGQGGGSGVYTLAMTDSLPVVKLPNYSFKNEGGFTFTNTSKNWGLDVPSFSNGAAYADLDNDGDLDVIINNINDAAFVYENTLNSKGQKSSTHLLTIAFKGDAKNTAGLGVRAYLYYGNGRQQVYEHYPTRGYLSTDDPRAHFGVGAIQQIDSVRVAWPDGKEQLLTNVAADQTLVLDYKNAGNKGAAAVATVPLFVQAAKEYGMEFKPKERDFVDYNIQATLPHKLSQYGPGIAVGDIDNNGFDDVYVGGTSGNAGVFFMQNASGTFTLDSARFAQKDDPLYEDMGVLFFDVDGDDDLDLYLASGSYEIPPGNPIAQDRLYMNDGKGYFKKSTGLLPAETVNGSCVRAADIDKDGDLDLFVGGRVVAGAYPTSPQSFIWRNDGGKFTDVTAQYCPQLLHSGMITDALWSDFDGDGNVDLILAGEWMPITFLKNRGNAFADVTTSTGILDHFGWWNSLAAGDFDGDGDIDYIAGNLGWNTNYTARPGQPLTILAKDLDKNGSLDPMVFCYMKAEDGTMQPFPMATKDDLATQMVSIRKKYPTFKSYGLATMDDLWTPADRQGALMLQANDMATSYIENKGNGQFDMKPLPLAAQQAPVYGMLSRDVDGDGNLDLLLAGNDYSMDPYSGRHDALVGVCLQGDGKDSFSPMPVAQSGFFVPGDGKGLATVHTAKNEDIIVATQNADSLLVFKPNAGVNAKKQSWILLKPDDAAADITFKNGTRRKVEFYYGSTYLSQSSRVLPVDENVVSLTITNFKGEKRNAL